LRGAKAFAPASKSKAVVRNSMIRAFPPIVIQIFLLQPLPGDLFFKHGGQLLVSGPTENFLYRIGRTIAGFTGEQHVTNIYAIEKVLAERLERVAIITSPFGVPLFRLSVWQKKSDITKMNVNAA
jgi:hypothetical protein